MKIGPISTPLSQQNNLPVLATTLGQLVLRSRPYRGEGDGPLVLTAPDAVDFVRY